jgi:hypothetical protein
MLGQVPDDDLDVIAGPVTSFGAGLPIETDSPGIGNWLAPRVRVGPGLNQMAPWSHLISRPLARGAGIK